MPTNTTAVQYSVGNSQRENKLTKGICRGGREEVTAFLLADDRIVYIEDPKKSHWKTPRIIKLSSVVEIKNQHTKINSVPVYQ